MSITHAEVDISAVAADARRVLTTNRLHGTSEWNGRTYDFVCPSPQSYPFQWLWDSAFHAIALLYLRRLNRLFHVKRKSRHDEVSPNGSTRS